MQTSAREFTLAIHGTANLRPKFQRVLEARYPKVTVYDRTRAGGLQNSSPVTLFDHPEVAEIDVFFKVSGPCDEITLRSGGQHRFFRFNQDHAENDEVRLERLLQTLFSTIEQLLVGAFVKVPELVVENEADTESEDPPTD